MAEWFSTVCIGLLETVGRGFKPHDGLFKQCARFYIQYNNLKSCYLRISLFVLKRTKYRVLNSLNCSQMKILFFIDFIPIYIKGN